MIFDYHNREDIQKYFMGNYLKFKETGDRVFRVTWVGNDIVKCMDSAGFELCIDLVAGYNVDYVIPGRKIFTYAGTAAMLYRKPARQFNRGMHDDNTGFSYLKENGTWGGLPFDFTTVESYVNKGAYHKARDLFPFTGDTQSKALSNQLAVSRLGHVMFGNNIIAKIDPNTRKGQVIPVYQREVKEILAGADITWEVKT